LYKSIKFNSQVGGVSTGIMLGKKILLEVVFILGIKTLKNKIILYFIIITIVPSIFLTFFYYKNTNEIYEDHMLENALDDIYYIKKSIDERISWTIGFADWFYRNYNFDNILTEDYSMKDPTYDYNMIKVYEQIQLQVINSPIGTYISSLIIVGENHVEFRYGNDASMIDISAVTSKDWFKDGISKNGTIYWSGITENPAKIKNNKYVLPIVRPIIDTKTYKKIGWVLITFKEELISDIYTSNKKENNYKYFILDQYGKVIPHQISKDLLDESGVYKSIYNILDQEQGYFHSNVNDEETLFVYEKLDRNDWILVEMLPLAGLNQQKKILSKITFAIFLSSLIFTSILIIYLSFNLTYPLKKLIEHVNRISTGRFIRNKDIEGQDEMGTLGIKINNMAGNIKELMDKIVEEEKEKRELELKALQNQINPHFLYNTLNSIKWMATVQGAEGIKNMVVALGRLLKNLSKNTVEKISLKEELSLLEDYIFIQEIRYKGRIKLNLEISDQELLKCKIIKFTLQPIVENSIFHGIEAKKNAGRIDLIIDADYKNDDLIIKIKDDGVGMSQERIREVLNKYDQSESCSRMKSIGLSNVNSRIKLSYGNAYGIDIKSMVGEGTTVIIRIPCQF